MTARGAEDADLIARVRKGDIEGFNLLVSRWEKRVFNYLLRLTGNPDDSLDLSQDVFLKAYQNIRKLDDTARFGPWLFRIAHNEAYSSFRKRRPEVAAPELEGAENFFDRQTAPGIGVDLSLVVAERSTGSARNSARPSSSRSIRVSNSTKWRRFWNVPSLP